MGFMTALRAWLEANRPAADPLKSPLFKSTYDTDNDGVVDNAAALGGYPLDDAAIGSGKSVASNATTDGLEFVTDGGGSSPDLLVGYIPMTYSYKGNAQNRQTYSYTTQDAMGRVALNADACNAAFGAGNWVLYVEGMANSNYATTNLYARITLDTAVAPGSGTRLTGAAAADELSCALTANGADYANLLTFFSIGPFSGALPASGGEALSVAFRNDQAAKTHYYVDVRVVARLAP